MKTTMKLCKSSFGRLIAFILCFVMTFTFIPFIDSEGTTANAETQTPTIKLGDYVQMGKYYEEPILWRCVGFYKVDEDGYVDLTETETEYKEGYLPLMLSDKILCLKTFDAKATNGDTGNSSHARDGSRYNSASNFWGDSNIRCWLNSTASAEAVEWICGYPPVAEKILRGEAYSDEAGFLKNFTGSEIKCMKEVKQDQLIDEYDSGMNKSGTEVFKINEIKSIESILSNYNEAYKVIKDELTLDTMFLLDVNQVHDVYMNGDILGDDYYLAKPTSKCVDNSSYTPRNKYETSLVVDDYFQYWLRSPSADTDAACETLLIKCDGSVSHADASSGYIGIRPAFYLDFSSSTVVYGDGSEDAPYSLEAGPTVTIDFENEQTEQTVDNTISYKKKGSDDWTSGSESGEYIKLEPGETYYFKYVETTAKQKNNYAVTVITTPNRPTTPSAPTVLSQTDTTVTLSSTDGYEYKCDNGNWQPSNEFTDLAEGQDHTFYQRVKATDSTFCSNRSLGTCIDNGIITYEQSIELGDYVRMGTYYEEPILWRCVGFYKVDGEGNVDLTDTVTEYKEGYLPLMLSDKILCLKAFDANGDVITGSHGRGEFRDYDNKYSRQLYGSSCWEDSNIRDWLNSKDQTVNWTCGNAPNNAPNEDHPKNGYNDYDTEAGFLTNFTANEINCMKKVSQYQILNGKEYEVMDETNGVEGSIYYECWSDISRCVSNFNLAYKKKITDTMFLLDENQVHEVYQNGEKLGDLNYYIGKPTSECVEKSEFKDPDLKDGNYWSYWLRSPFAYPANSYYVRNVDSYGDVSNTYAYLDWYGVRPAFYLDLSSTSFVSGDGTDQSPLVVAKDSTPDKPEVTVDYENEQTVQNIASTIEYQVKGSAEWTTGQGVQVKLDPGKTYIFRVKATDRAAASKVTAIRIPNRPATPSAPTVKSKTETTVTLEATEGYEYKRDNGDWQDSNLFENLTDGQNYTFYQRVKATENKFCSCDSEGTNVVTGIEEVIKSATPTVLYRTFTSITLKPIEGYVYKCDNGKWTDNNEFTGLETGKTYKFYQKEKNSDDKYASEPLEINTLTYGDVITSAVGITGVTAYLAVIAKNKLISKWFLTSNGIFGKKVNSWVKNLWTNMMR